MNNNARRSLLRLILATVVLGCGLAMPWEVEGQTVVYPGSYVLEQPAYLHYHRVYQGTTWHWRPWLGWHRHDYYADVPCSGSGYYIYDPYQPVHVVGRRSLW